MSRIDRIRRAVSALGAPRAETDGPEGASAASGANLPVPVEPVARVRAPADERRGGDSEFAAQMIGQDGQRRGLRAGPLLIDAARTAYNRVEWSGAYDRRARVGRRARTDI